MCSRDTPETVVSAWAGGHRGAMGVRGLKQDQFSRHSGFGFFGGGRGTRQIRVIVVAITTIVASEIFIDRRSLGFYGELVTRSRFC
jgi:hypothetical protein